MRRGCLQTPMCLHVLCIAMLPESSSGVRRRSCGQAQERLRQAHVSDVCVPWRWFQSLLFSVLVWGLGLRLDSGLRPLRLESTSKPSPRYRRYSGPAGCHKLLRLFELVDVPGFPGFGLGFRDFPHVFLEHRRFCGACRSLLSRGMHPLPFSLVCAHAVHGRHEPWTMSVFQKLNRII